MPFSLPAAVVAPPRSAQLHLFQQHTSTTRTRFYAHRIHESLTSRIAMFLCSILLTLILVCGILLLILWLSLRPHRPRLYLSSFSADSPSLSAFSFSVSDNNPNSKIAIYYDDVSATVFYNNRQLASGPILFAFYQPPKNTTEIRGQITAADSVRAGAGDNASASKVALRLELNTEVRFSTSVWDTRHHKMHVNCYLVVGPDGNLLPEFRDEKCPLYFG